MGTHRYHRTPTADYSGPATVFLHVHSSHGKALILAWIIVIIPVLLFL